MSVVVASTGCGGSSDDDDADPAVSSDPTTAGRMDLTVVDDTRPTPADPERNLPDRPDRTLPVVVLYPEHDGEPAAGPFPLVVFAHGHSRAGTEYEDLLAAWVRAGYVVAAPDFPLSSGTEATTQISYADVLNQPGDLGAIVDQLTTDSPLAQTIDPDAVAVVGHSLGAITVLGLRNNTCCTEPAVRAVVAIAGATLPFPGEPVTGSATPLLLIHGGADPTVPVAGSEAVFQTAAPPVSFLRFTEGGHDEVFDGGGPPAALTEAAILAFLDRTLRDQDERWTALTDEVEESGLGILQERSG